jgi:adenine phosphoribosyltransferase
MTLNLADYIRDCPNFPKQGILFKDITPLLQSPDAYSQCISQLREQWADIPYDAIAAFDARGFLFGGPLALVERKPLIMLRKKGKLPGECASVTYGLEYGRAELEVQRDVVKPGSRVLLVDDLLATGGTTKAGCELLEGLGAKVVGCAYVVELTDLPGRSILTKYDVRSVLRY